MTWCVNIWRLFMSLRCGRRKCEEKDVFGGIFASTVSLSIFGWLGNPHDDVTRSSTALWRWPDLQYPNNTPLFTLHGCSVLYIPELELWFGKQVISSAVSSPWNNEVHIPSFHEYCNQLKPSPLYLHLAKWVRFCMFLNCPRIDFQPGAAWTRWRRGRPTQNSPLSTTNQ
jgi:hypothetical protein